MENLPLVLYLAVQLVGVTWWASRAQARIEALEEGVDDGKGHGERMARIEGSIKNIENTLGHFDKRLPKVRTT